MKPTLGIGWDVRGWLGKQQAVAAVTWSGTELRWLGKPHLFDITALHHSRGSLRDFIRLAWPDASDDVLQTHRVVVAIDAPLGFPAAFRELLVGETSFERPLGPEIENRFAYRDTDRHIYGTFRKKPLSASFDKLGNVATVAIWHARRWSQEPNVRIVPIQAAQDTDHAIIEVYPALAKPSRLSACHLPFGALLPSDVPLGTDEYDAAICAVLALSFGMNGTEPSLPLLVHPHGVSADDLTTEGWIYYAEAEWFTAADQAASRIQPS